jgi:hypothetical protein
MSPKSEFGQPRRVIIVGHDVKQDIQFLNTLDFDVYAMANLLEVVDNQKLHQHRNKFYNGQSLCTILAGFDIPYRYLHNAGNDAMYTLQSLLSLAVIKRQESLARALERQASCVSSQLIFRVLRKLTAFPRSDTVNRRIEPDAEAGWSTGGEDTDGGHPPVTYLGPSQKRE